jgi:hypothetical protein
MMLKPFLIGVGMFSGEAAFAVTYERTYAGVVPGTTSAPGGGMTFLPSDPNTLLFGLPTPGTPANGTIRAYGVTRDAQNHVTGFTGTSTLFATAPSIGNNGLAFGPSGVLFFGAGTSVGQIKPGSTATDKMIDLAAISGFTFAGGGVVNEINSPVGDPSKANIVVHYPPTSANFYEATLTADGSGTFNISSPTFTQFVGNLINYDTVPPGLPNAPQAYGTIGGGGVISYMLDANNRPMSSQGVDSFSAGAGAVDPLTGDYLFVHPGTDPAFFPGIHVVSPVPEPAALGLAAIAGTSLLARRRVR